MATESGKAALKKAQAKYMATESGKAALKKAQAKYMAANKTYTLLLNRTRDADIISYLENQSNITAYLKTLIRKNMIN